MRRFLFPFAALLTLGSLSCGGSKDNTAPTPTAPTPFVPVVTSVRVTLARAAIQTSDTVTATAVVLDQRGQPVTGQTVTWRSSDSTIASVSAGGVVFGETSGSPNITATVEAKSGTASLVVQKSVRYKKWLAIKALGDSLRADRARYYVFANTAEIDLDGDRDVDLFTLEGPGGADVPPVPFRLWRNLGDTAFVRVEQFIAPFAGATSFVVADFNGDGRDDIFAPMFGKDAPPFPGERQKLYLQSVSGMMTDRSDLMPTRTMLGNAGCVSKTRRKAMVIAGNNNMTMTWTGQRFDEALWISPSIRYVFQPGDGFFPNASPSAYWTCAFFDADGDGVEDLFLGSGNSTGYTQPFFPRSRDVFGNSVGATHAILWGEAGSDTLRYKFPASAPSSGVNTPSWVKAVHYVITVTADFDGDGCVDVATTGGDYLSNEIVDIVQGCVPRDKPRVPTFYRWEVNGTLTEYLNGLPIVTMNSVPGGESQHNHMKAVDVNGDNAPDLVLVNTNLLTKLLGGPVLASNSIGAQVRIGINNGRGGFTWRLAQSSDNFSAMPLRAQVLQGWTWDPRAR